MVCDLFAGPGGWEVGAQPLGLAPHGVELDPVVCATRRAAGHYTLEADVAEVRPERWQLDGLIASPPCPLFSQAGLREGTRDLALLHACAYDLARGENRIAEYRDRVAVPDALLVLEPLRWALLTQPTWVVLEQVPPVLELWQWYARWLQAHGYSAWAGVLNAADYGVPQVRKRAILMAHRERHVHPPEPTHTNGGGMTLFGELKPWVTMADALGWPEEAEVGFPRRTDGREETPEGYRARDFFPASGPAPTLTEKGRSWVVNTGRDWKPGGDRSTAQRVPSDQPAPTIDGKGRWHRERADAPRDPDWPRKRPATTVQGDPRIAQPGHKAEQRDADDSSPGRMEGAIRVSLEEAAALQGFPEGYPWQGTMTQQFTQVGNAVPPPLARAVLEVLA